jgi:hypothetical protein
MQALPGFACSGLVQLAPGSAAARIARPAAILPEAENQH